MGHVVLVTGVSGDIGRRYARRIAAAPEVDRVVGVDVQPPRGDFGDAQFVRADIRNPVIAKVIVRERVDTVVHLSVVANPVGAGTRNTTKELNVIGSMQLLAACQQAPDVRKLVLKSSSAIYGATNRDPAMFTEQMSAKRLPGSGFAKDVTEVEGYARGFARRRPDVAVTILRTANVLGPSIVSAMGSFFRLPVIPKVLGFDPRLQFLHEEDMLGVLTHATTSEATGIFNVAGDGVLKLSQAVRRLGRPTIALPSFAAASFGSLVRQTRVSDLSSEEMAFLTFGRGIDTTRMHAELGFCPGYTTAETFADFAASVKPGVLAPARVRALEETLRGSVAAWGSTDHKPVGGGRHG